jgi:putative NIF3 family GTP cyclohydrolase 1 type 2
MVKLPTPSRREFLALAGAGAMRAQSGALTARQVIERIQKNVGVPWRAQTVDTFKAGNPDTPVKGIATTVMATFDVIQRASAGGRNLVITHEPTFYSHEDKVDDLATDPVFKAKQGFIDKNSIVVWRFHDHWHAHRPDGIFTGMIEALGWQKYVGENGRMLTLPSTTLKALAAEVQSKLKIRTIRVIGDPQTKVSTVSFGPGYSGNGRMLSREGVDVVMIGEAREWEGIEYAQDLIASGQKKGMIILGHAISEESGMNNCAKWLRTFITEVPVDFIPAGEPFWAP